MTINEKLQVLPILLPVMILSLTLHELAHAYVALALGDRTARQQGRLSPNPIHHLDPFGTGMLLFTFLFTPFMFGWAKPVPVDPRNFRNHKWGMAVVAIAGPATNFLIALGVMALAVHGMHRDIFDTSDLTGRIVFTIIELNIVLGVFNLFPVPPLDGSRVIGALMPDQLYRRWAALDQFGPVFLLLLFFVFQRPFQTLMLSGIDHSFRALATLAGVPGA